MNALELATEAARRLIARANRADDQTLSWASGFSDEGVPDDSLYGGTAGVVVFLTELAARTGDEHVAAAARAGAGHLARAPVDDPSLYLGIAGVGFALAAAGRVLNEPAFTEAARAIAGRLAREDGRWNGVLDVVSGTAGIVLFLLWAERALQIPTDGAVARAAERLRALARPIDSGTEWPMDETGEFPRIMPNFSHGTAGIAYALAAAGDLESAQAGARRLTAIANADGLIMHHRPGGEDLFYLGWCHGPVGTARLWRALHAYTDEAGWETRYRGSVRTLLDTGIPERRTDGFWNNLGLCCGSASVGWFALDAARARIDGALDLADAVAGEIAMKAERDDEGIFWTHAPGRIAPDDLRSPPGLMQGAAGIGRFLLRYNDVASGRADDPIRLPDEVEALVPHTE